MLSLARISARRPATCLAVTAVLTLAFAALLPRLELRTDGAALHPRGDITVEQTEQDRLVFGDPETLILLLTSRAGGPSLTSSAGLLHVARTHAAVAALPSVQASGVRSAASLVDVATSGVASLGTFLDEVPGDDELAPLLRRMRQRPLTDGLFLAAGGNAAAIYAPLLPGQDRRQVVAELERWAAARDDEGFDLRLTGPVIAETLLGERILADLARLVPIMVLVVALLLLICLRTLGGLLVAMCKTLVVLVWTGGLMAVAGIPITLVTTILPVLLLALCVTDEVHVVARLQAKLRRDGSELAGEVLATLGELYRPVVYTSISTAIGFLSFLSASIVPIRHFGALAATGILLAMVMTFTLTPALAVTLPRSWFVPRGPGLGPRWSRTTRGGRHTAALVAGLLLLAAGLPGLLRLSVQDSWIDNFDPDSPLVRAEQEFNAAFWGTYRFDVVLTGPPGFFHLPEGAALVAEAARIAGDAPTAGGVVTYLEPLDTVAELLGLSANAAALPGDALKAVVEVSASYARQTGLERLVTPDGHAARLLVVVNSPDYVRSRALAEHLEQGLRPRVEGSGVSYHASGDIPLATATVRAIVHDQLRSIAWTLAGIGLLLLVVNRKPWLTLTQLVPPAAAAWLILAGMGYAGLALGVATSMFTALTLGVGVDLALHVTYAYERERALGTQDAVRAALGSTAAGRRWSTAVLALGFLVLSASTFRPNHDLGLLLAAAMVTSYLTTYLFVPRLLTARRRGVWGIALVCLLNGPPSHALERPDAATLLRRADLVRNPYLGTAVEVDLSVVSSSSGRLLRRSQDILLTHRHDRTLVLLRQEDRTAPGALLIADDTYWLLLPHAERPVKLAFQHVVAGDLSHAGFLRINLRARYEPRYDGEEMLGDIPCWRLELEPKSEPAPFGRVRYWVSQSGFLPIRIEFYGPAGELLKTARFTAFQDTGLGRRPARIEIEDTRRPDERATLTLGQPSGVRTSGLTFDLDDLLALRSAARRLATESADPVSGPRLVEALVARQLSGTSLPRRRR